MAIQPRQPAPPLSAPLAGGGSYTLGRTRPENFTVVVFFRGLHCPVCNAYLNAFQDRLDAFAERGTEIVAMSMETPERAEKCKSEWGLDRLAVGHSVDEATARAWGLYITQQRDDDEPPQFCEPGLFVVDADGTLAVAVFNTGPRLRPRPDDVLEFIDMRLARR